MSISKTAKIKYIGEKTSRAITLYFGQYSEYEYNIWKLNSNDNLDFLQKEYPKNAAEKILIKAEKLSLEKTIEVNCLIIFIYIDMDYLNFKASNVYLSYFCSFSH